MLSESARQRCERNWAFQKCEKTGFGRLPHLKKLINWATKDMSIFSNYIEVIYWIKYWFFQSCIQLAGSLPPCELFSPIYVISKTYKTVWWDTVTRDVKVASFYYTQKVTNICLYLRQGYAPWQDPVSVSSPGQSAPTHVLSS